MTATRLTLVLAGILFASPLAAQTYAERLERAIFTEQTVGDLEGAVQMYFDLMTAPAVPREIAAAAEARLLAVARRRMPAHTALPPAPAAALAASQAGVPAGTVTWSARDDGATREALLERHQRVVAAIQRVWRGECCGPFSGNYDPGRPVTISGAVAAMEWLNPQTVVHVKGADGTVWGFTMLEPNRLLRAGMNRNTLRPGDRVLVNGYAATGIATGCPAPLPNSCATLGNDSRHASAATVTGDDGRTIFDRREIEQREYLRLLEQQQELEEQLFGASAR